MERIDMSNALITAINSLQLDKNLNEEERLTYQNDLIKLREMILEGNLLSKSNIVDGLGRIAERSYNEYDDKTTIEFDKCKLTNLLGANIDRIVGRTSGSVSVGIRD